MAAEQNKAEEQTCCPVHDKIVSCNIACWKDVKKTGAIVAGGNVAFLTLFFEIPIVSFFLTYAGILALLGGAFMKFSGKIPSDSVPELDTLVPCFTEEKLISIAKAQFAMINKAFAAIAPILFWKDMPVSAAITLGLYVFTIFLGYVSITTLAFLAFNGVFVYGKFHKEINAATAPHVAKAKKALSELMSKIPTAKKAQ